MRATLLRLTSECSVTASHASKIGPQLWSSESFKKRLQILRENALEQHDFPQSLYPLMPPRMRMTHIGEFVDAFKDVSAERLKSAPVKTGFTLNGTVTDMGYATI
jgi:hypothetical protein